MENARFLLKDAQITRGFTKRTMSVILNAECSKAREGSFFAKQKSPYKLVFLLFRIENGYAHRSLLRFAPRQEQRSCSTRSRGISHKPLRLGMTRSNGALYPINFKETVFEYVYLQNYFTKNIIHDIIILRHNRIFISYNGNTFYQYGKNALLFFAYRYGKTKVVSQQLELCVFRAWLRLRTFYIWRKIWKNFFVVLNVEVKNCNLLERNRHFLGQKLS